jgi:hypothetical protein
MSGEVVPHHSLEGEALGTVSIEHHALKVRLNVRTLGYPRLGGAITGSGRWD